VVVYRKISFKDQGWINEALKYGDLRGCEYCFSNLFLWGGLFGTDVTQIEGCLCTMDTKTEKAAVHLFPVGANPEKAVRILLADDRERGKASIFRGLAETEKGWMESVFPGVFSYQETRSSWDYLYPVEALKNLAGRKYHGKRNHIARFLEGGDWSYEPIRAVSAPGQLQAADVSSSGSLRGNLGECRDMYQDWLVENYNRLKPSIEQEKAVVNGCFAYFRELGLEGGILKQNGETVGFCIGKPLNSDTYVVHVEKAYTHVQGAYPMLNQQFVIHNMDGYRYVNREDDMGEEGLRKAKLSYYPEPLLKKYSASTAGVSDRSAG
jgi:hypothetical protein